MDLLIATTNVHKIREIKIALKKNSRFDLYTLHDFSAYNPLEEIGKTFEENAKVKALHASSFSGMTAIADDSGLVVPALGGAPGIYSARYAGSNATDKENRKKLLNAMKGFDGIARTAFFECSIALAIPDRVLKYFRGICEGLILKEEKGRGGFGYDPLFRKYDYHLTFAELDEKVKNQISHRGKALEKLLLFLERGAT